MFYSGYDDELLNSKWCYAETTSCTDATSIEYKPNRYLEEGRFGASQKACFKDEGKTLLRDVNDFKHFFVT